MKAMKAMKTQKGMKKMKPMKAMKAMKEMAEDCKAWRLMNPEYHKAYYRKNREKLKETAKAWYLKNRAIEHESDRRVANPDRADRQA